MDYVNLLAPFYYLISHPVQSIVIHCANELISFFSNIEIIIFQEARCS